MKRVLSRTGPPRWGTDRPNRIRLAWMMGVATVWLVHGTAADAAGFDEHVAQVDVVSPVPLEVVNPERTEALRQQAAAKVPIVYRFDPNIVTQTETALRERFFRIRTRFWETMEQAARRPKLEPATVQHPSFFRFANWFRNQYPDFPLSTNLARTWALRQPDDPILETWTKQLRTAMNQCVISDSDLAPSRSEFALARVVSEPMNGQALTRKQVDKEGVTLSASDIITLAEARYRLASGLMAEQPTFRAFLTGFLRENCRAERDLTLAIRQEAVSNILAVDRYKAGQIIVKRGDRIDAKARAALDLLNTETAIRMNSDYGSPPAGKTTDGLTSLHQSWRRTLSAPLRLENTALRSLLWLAVISLIATILVAWLVRRRRLRRRPRAGRAGQDVSYAAVVNPNRNETVFLPLQPPAGVTAQVQSDTTSDSTPPPKSVVAASDQFWHQRALEAERRAEEILALVRAGLAPQLARQMMHRLVQELISQRADWLQTQQIAEQDLTEIERRFTAAHGQLVDRLRAFEKRTEELEKALTVKAEENSQLIKAHIAITQNQIKTKESAQETIWN